MDTFAQLMQQSAGVGAGLAIGSAVGFTIRKHRTGSSEGLVGGSVFVTSALCGALGMGVMMVFMYIGVV